MKIILLKLFKYEFISSIVVIIKIHPITQTKFNNKFKFFKKFRK